LNDRLNGIVTNYSSILSNADTFSDNFTTTAYTDVTATTTAAYNSTLGSIQNDHSAWVAIAPSPTYAYGNIRNIGTYTVYGNKVYVGTYGYGVKVLNLDTEQLAEE
jgi:hypothetical protein